MKKMLSLLLAALLLTALLPASVFADVTVTQPIRFQKVSMGGNTAFALDREGNLWSWGLVDIDSSSDIPMPKRTSTPEKLMENVKDISAGYMHAVAMKTDGTVWTWGSNFDGRLGDGTETERFTPAKIMDNVTAISAGSYHSLAIKNDGSLWAWGANSHGQIGDGTTTSALFPKKVADSVIGISAGEDESLFIKSDHSLWGMGSQSGAELGSLSFDNQLTPVRVMGDVSAVCCHDGLIIKTDGSVWEYGMIWESEQKKFRTQNMRRVAEPQKVLDNAVSIASGSLLRFVVQRDGSLWSWGTNMDGQLGDGTDVGRSSPKKAMDGVAQVSTNGRSCLAVKQDGTLWVWGSNEQGILGDGTTTDHYAPVQLMLTETVTLPTQFYDVQPGTYYVDAVQWAVSHEPQITTGTGEGIFSPDNPCTRGQMVTFLWRAAGCPEPETTSNLFSDVNPSDFYYKAVLWAYENKITTGTTETTFAPNETVNRAQSVTFLWRSAGQPRVEGGNPFTDVQQGQYYTDAVIWAAKSGVTTGTTSMTFSPDNPCVRGQIVTFLYRYAQL